MCPINDITVCMPQAIRDVKKVCEDADLAMAPTALSWCLQQPAVQSVIAGAANPEQVQKNSNIIKIPQVGDMSYWINDRLGEL